MYLSIGKESRVLDLQNEFNRLYPYLKLEFFRNPSKDKKLKKAAKANPDEYLERLTHIYKPGSIVVDHKKTVAQIVDAFWEEFGLSVLVFRKSGKLWIETSLTDIWTLEKQNKIGESFSGSPDGLS